MERTICIYVFDGYSDWEIAYLTPEIHKSQDHNLIYVSDDGHPVTSMGGLSVQPQSSLGEVDLEELKLLILPGGELWEKGAPPEIDVFVNKVYNLAMPIAAICAATTFLANCGMLDTIRHTSNDLHYLKALVPAYKGEEQYQNALAITGEHIITANGIAPIEFAREIFTKIELHDEEWIEDWFQLFKNGIWKG